MAEAQDVVGKTYENLILPDSIKLNDPGALYVIRDGELMDEDTTIKKCTQLLNAFNDYQVNEKDITVEQSSNGYLEAQYFSDAEKAGTYSCYFSNNGSITLWQPYAMQKAGFPRKEEIYEVEKDDLSSVVYTADGERYSAQQALDYAESIVNSKLKDYIARDSLVPKYVIAAENSENSDYTYYVGYSYCIDSVEINNSQVVRYLDDISMMSSRMEIMISSPDTVTQVTGGALKYMTAEKIEEDNFITLDSALDHVDEILAEYFINDIQEIDIIYAGITAYGKENEEFYDEYRPMWRFTVKDVSNSQCMPARYSIFVDMQTGAIILNNDARGEFISDTYIFDKSLEDIVSDIESESSMN